MQMEREETWPASGVVAVVGLGKIGLPLAVQYASCGWRVLGCDVNPSVVDEINQGRTHIREESELESLVPRLVEQGLLSATLETTAAVARADVVVVIVPVQVDASHQVRFEALDEATMAIGRGLRPGTLVVYETTLPVGTTEGRIQAMLEGFSHLDAERDFYLAYSPERVSSGSIFRDLMTYPKVVGAIDARSTQVAVSFYRSVLPADIKIVASCAEAEFVKLIDTIYRDVNIALANEFACYADEHGLDALNAIEVANTQPYAHIHQPGVGVGGHCIPVYPYFLLNNSSEKRQNCTHGLRLLSEARLINDGMAEHAVQRIELVLGSLHQRTVLVLGVAYRGGVRETAFSCAYRLQTALDQRGATVYFDDPLYKPDELLALGFQPLPPACEGEVDAMVLQAAHQSYQQFDFRLFSHCQVVLDGRNGLERTRVEQAGIRYIAPGDGGALEAELCVVNRG